MRVLLAFLGIVLLGGGFIETTKPIEGLPTIDVGAGRVVRHPGMFGTPDYGHFATYETEPDGIVLVKAMPLFRENVETKVELLEAIMAATTFEGLVASLSRMDGFLMPAGGIEEYIGELRGLADEGGMSEEEFIAGMQEELSPAILSWRRILDWIDGEIAYQIVFRARLADLEMSGGSRYFVGQITEIISRSPEPILYSGIANELWGAKVGESTIARLSAHSDPENKVLRLLDLDFGCKGFDIDAATDARAALTDCVRSRPDRPLSGHFFSLASPDMR